MWAQNNASCGLYQHGSFSKLCDIEIGRRLPWKNLDRSTRKLSCLIDDYSPDTTHAASFHLMQNIALAACTYNTPSYVPLTGCSVLFVFPEILSTMCRKRTTDQACRLRDGRWCVSMQRPNLSCWRASFLPYVLTGGPPYILCACLIYHVYTMYIYNSIHIWRATRNVKNPPANNYGPNLTMLHQSQGAALGSDTVKFFSK